jgi:flagellum-specific peptidoglycan hydrolase FlgJ
MGTYRIQRGDTLWALSRKFGTTVDALVKANGIKDPDLIITGHTLEIPGAGKKTRAKPPSKYDPPAPRPSIPSQPERPASPGPIGNLPKTGIQFIDKYAPGAIRSMQSTGVPASVTMAQAILESGWGRSGLTRKAFNFFGIKGTGPAGSITVPTREVYNGRSVMVNAAFRRYHNAAESFIDHGQMLRRMSRYAKCFRYRNDPEQFCRELQKAGYATDPNYANALISIIRQYKLDRFDQRAAVS